MGPLDLPLLLGSTSSALKMMRKSKVVQIQKVMERIAHKERLQSIKDNALLGDEMPSVGQYDVERSRNLMMT